MFPDFLHLFINSCQAFPLLNNTFNKKNCFDRFRKVQDLHSYNVYENTVLKLNKNFPNAEYRSRSLKPFIGNGDVSI